MNGPRVFTIGFTQKSAAEFFGLLRKSGAKKLIDVRLNNVSQLAGFAKRDDLQFFLRELCQMEYAHEPRLAPTKALLDAYKKEKGDWPVYERNFIALMQQRRIEKIVSPAAVDMACLLCSEHTPEHCHRRLVVEYLGAKWGGINVTHLIE
jgi:uncharacterized protein (DUF488 family)